MLDWPASRARCASIPADSACSRIASFCRRVPGMPSINWYGVMAPAATPPAIVARLRSALREVGKLPAVLDGIRKLGLEPEFEDDFGAALDAQRREWAVMARETRITLE